MSIFGNYDADLIRRTWIKLASTLKKNKNQNNQTSNEVQQILYNMLHQAIYTITGNRLNFVIKHCNENAFSPADLSKFIDKLKLEGYDTKIIFLDYLDLMRVSDSSSSKGDNEYFTHGQILHELRIIARSNNIALVSITQNQRGAENMDQNMSNSLIGDSYKKVRYADYILMLRQRSDLDLLNNKVKEHLVDNSSQQLTMTTMTNIDTSKLIPLEMKITKAKEGKRDIVRFHLFDGATLRVHNTLGEYLGDLASYKTENAKLASSIDLLGEVGLVMDSTINLDLI